mmetsp:Transcript_30429/g.47671  ORF Transcript_30429/g.47671 Transcript_30429/m.47671 type:complete len:129 (+) Transcript_30429:1-387(+)
MAGRCAASGTRVKQAFRPQNPMMKSFLITARKCAGCGNALASGSSSSALCPACETEREDLVIVAESNYLEAQHQQKTIWKKCMACSQIEDSNFVGKCKNITCANLSGRLRADKDFERRTTELNTLINT